MPDLLNSPIDLSAFSTPPTTPRPPPMPQMPTVPKRSSGLRPQSLTLDKSDAGHRPPIVIDSTSPPLNVNDQPSQNATGSGATIASPASHMDMPGAYAASPPSHPVHTRFNQQQCFVHSGLDRAASLTEWLDHGKHISTTQVTVPPGSVACPPQRQMPPEQKLAVLKDVAAELVNNRLNEDGDGDGDGDDAEGVGSLTKQLAETAVGVREMSKQLGRARVHSNIQNVLIITKARDNRLINLTRDLALYLMLKKRQSGRGLVVYVDSQLRTSRRFDASGIERDYPELFRPVLPKRRTSTNMSTAASSASLSLMRSVPSDAQGNHMLLEDGQLRYWTSDMCISSPHLFDFVVTLGGDGTVLFTSWLFQRIVPPVLSFALGSLGFLTNFDFSDHQAVMESAIENGIRVNLRMRFTCTVYRAVANTDGKGRKAVKKGDTGEILMKNVGEGGWEALEGGISSALHNPCKDKEIMCYTTRPAESFEVINDLVVDRGPSPYVSLLELFADEHHLTTVQADGLTISTPTGSTAYSLSAGGSLVHPEIPALLITPICPHTLSFRPMLLPDTMELRVCVPYNSRSTAWASFDGRGRVGLKQGDHIKITASKYPFPTVCADKQSTDWFHAIARTLKWNERERQKSFVVVEEGTPDKEKRQKKVIPHGINSEEVLEEGDEEDEEKFDIDDSSPEANSSSAPQSRAETPMTSEPSPTAAAAAMAKGFTHLLSKSTHSGIESPDRFGAPAPHPHKSSPRGRDGSTQATAFSIPSQRDEYRQIGEHGDRDNIHGPRHAHTGGRSRIPRDRDLDAEIVRTPRPFEVRAQSRDGPRRAFAVWGHDESSDSNASDSELEST